MSDAAAASGRGVLLADTLVQAQEAVLGSMLIDGDIVGSCLQRISPEDFIVGRYKAVYYAIRRVYNAGGIPDAVTVNGALGGGYGDILIHLMDVTGTSANWELYAEQLRDTSRLYRVQQLGEKLMNAETWAAAQALEDQIHAAGCDRQGVRITTLADCYSEFLDRHAEGKQPAYMTFGISSLDDMVYVEGGDLVVIGGYPSAGKSALALQIGYHAAREKRVGYFYLENSDRKLFERLVAARTLVSFSKIKRYTLGEDDFRAIAAAQGSLLKPSLEFISASGMTVSDIRSTALAKHYDIVIVDYLQKIRGAAGRRNMSDFERVSEISSDLQELGRQTGIVVLALSQLSRPERKNGRTPAPGMHSFRQSGQIEQDADVALLLYKETDTPGSPRILKIGKNKEGEAAVGMRMFFDGDHQTFSRVSPCEEPPQKERQKPRQVSFWDGWEPLPDEEETPFDTGSGGEAAQT